MKRVFNIDVEICNQCGANLKVIVEVSNRCIEDPGVIQKILTHRDCEEPEEKEESEEKLAVIPESRAPPKQDHFS